MPKAQTGRSKTTCYNSKLMQSEIEQQLTEKAKRRFGEAQTLELKAEIAKVAADLALLQTFTITIHNEA